MVKRGKAKFPQKSVHEQIDLDGEVGWLSEDLLHYDSPTFERYLNRLNRYTDLQAQELREASFFQYTIYKPLYTFVNLYLRHKGFLDLWQGFVFSFFSSLRFPISYIKSWRIKEGNKS